MKLPLTWPKSSDSSSVSVRPAQLTATNGPAARVELHVDRAGDQVLADAALAGDQDLRFAHRRPAGDREDFEHGGTGRNNDRVAAWQFVSLSTLRDIQHCRRLHAARGPMPHLPVGQGKRQLGKRSKFCSWSDLQDLPDL